MPQNRHFYFILIILFALFLCGCARKQTVCPSDEGTPQSALSLAELIKQPPPTSEASELIEVIIQGRKMKVDKLVDYPLCNDNWSGAVYVGCSVQVAEAELDAQSNPLFLKGCDLNIAPNTVVYVAAHNDAPYYKGCSCHTGTASQP
ncbi:MAG: hypothetical protein WCC12_12550 [Anaerolineales bacterium]